MYSRSTNEAGEPDDFGVSGKLWNGVLVMYDRRTGSLWTQLDGRSIDGPRTGERLQHLDSVYTTWAAWLAQHPDTLVLDKPEDERERKGSLYADYFGDPDRLFLPELNEGLGGVAAKDVVFGARVGDAQTAVTETLLASVGLVNGFVGAVPVAWSRDGETGAVRGLDRRLDGRVLILEPAASAGHVRDLGSETVLSIDALTPIRIDRSFWYGWKRSFPDSRVIAN